MEEFYSENDVIINTEEKEPADNITVDDAVRKERRIRALIKDE